MPNISTYLQRAPRFKTQQEGVEQDGVRARQKETTFATFLVPPAHGRRGAGA
jgi:hypothetical protein